MFKFALIISLVGFFLLARADTTGVCTAGPNETIKMGPSACSCSAGTITMSTTVHVVKVTAADQKVYRFVQNVGPQASGDAVMIEAGTAPVNTMCDATQSLTTKGATYYRVDRKIVTFTGNNRPPTVWSKCPG